MDFSRFNITIFGQNDNGQNTTTVLVYMESNPKRSSEFIIIIFLILGSMTMIVILFIHNAQKMNEITYDKEMDRNETMDLDLPIVHKGKKKK